MASNFTNSFLPTYAFAGNNNIPSLSNNIGDIIVHVTNSNASAADIGNAVADKVSSAINMPERPIVAVRERRGSIG